SEVPALFCKGILPVNVALIQVSPPDRHGFCSLGVSVDVTRAAVHVADRVVAQVNPHMPRTHGDGVIHISNIDYAVEVSDHLPASAAHQLTEAELAIGQACADLVENGATLQTGI